MEKNGDWVTDGLCDKLRERAAVGLKKYGVTLGGNQASTPERVEHALQEAMDLCAYLYWLKADLLNDATEKMTTPEQRGWIPLSKGGQPDDMTRFEVACFNHPYDTEPKLYTRRVFWDGNEGHTYYHGELIKEHVCGDLCENPPKVTHWRPLRKFEDRTP